MAHFRHTTIGLRLVFVAFAWLFVFFSPLSFHGNGYHDTPWRTFNTLPSDCDWFSWQWHGPAMGLSWETIPSQSMPVMEPQWEFVVLP